MSAIGECDACANLPSNAAIAHFDAHILELHARILALEAREKALVGLIRRWVDFENGKRNLDTLKGIKERAEALLNEPKEERE